MSHVGTTRHTTHNPKGVVSTMRSERRRVVSGQPEAEATEAERGGAAEGQWPVDSDQSDATQEADMNAERDIEWTDGPDPFLCAIDEEATIEDWDRFTVIRGLLTQLRIAAKSLAHMPTNWDTNPDDYKAAACKVLSATLKIADALEAAQQRDEEPCEAYWGDREPGEYEVWQEKCDHWERVARECHMRYLAARLCPHTTREHVVIALCDWGQAYWEREQLQSWWD